MTKAGRNDSHVDNPEQRRSQTELYSSGYTKYIRPIYKDPKSTLLRGESAAGAGGCPSRTCRVTQNRTADRLLTHPTIGRDGVQLTYLSALSNISSLSSPSVDSGSDNMIGKAISHYLSR